MGEGKGEAQGMAAQVGEGGEGGRVTQKGEWWERWRWVRPAVDRWRRERREGRVRGGEGAAAEESGEEEEGRSEGEGGEGGGDTEGKGGQKGRILTRAPVGLRLRWMIEGKGPPWAQR